MRTTKVSINGKEVTFDTYFQEYAEIKKKEVDQLKSVLSQLGLSEFEFDDRYKPIVAAYCFDNPADVYVDVVRIKHIGSGDYVEIDSAEKESGEMNTHSIFDVFEGHITYITDAIVWQVDELQNK